MVRLILLIVLLGAYTSAYGQHSMMEMAAEKPEKLMTGLGPVHHRVSTSNAEAQKFFEQGLALIYAFNHEEAIRSFKQAAELDPKMAMAYWGIAYALGPNINLDVDPEREKAAFDAVQRAMELAANAPENERDYINALSKRYSDTPGADLKKLAINYKDAIGKVAKKYPDDLDASVLYAESIMDLNPWKLWTNDGKPAEGTEELVSVLESVLKKSPNHIGAIHYYIHAVEASPNPERASMYLDTLKKLTPSAGHLVHMPAHIYIRTGDYAAAVKSNREAQLVDETFIKQRGQNGIYPMMYYTHNIHFETVASALEGNYRGAINAAKKLENFILPMAKEMPMVEGFAATPMLVNVRFRKWDELIKTPQPEKNFTILNAFWHFSRGVAFAGKGQIEKAEGEHKLFAESRKAIPADVALGLNSQSDVFDIAEDVLSGEIAKARHDYKKALRSFTQGVEAEGKLSYDEPPDWWLFVRESLGGALLLNKNPATAEKVFREDLLRNRKNGRSLFGLLQSLKAQKKTKEAAKIQRQFNEAWKNADVVLKVNEL